MTRHAMSGALPPSAMGRLPRGIFNPKKPGARNA